LSKSKFLNGKTLKLLAFLKTKYEKKSFDLKDGVDLVADFMENFGMRFEDRPQQPYCHVLDI
jgi:antitoxin component HigA of HigAB toxin-antitoxin module